MLRRVYDRGMELVIGFLNSVLIPILFVVGALGTLGALIASIAEAGGRKPRPWRFVLYAIIYWIILIVAWTLVNVLYGAFVG